jgi:hypothetical protein
MAGRGGVGAPVDRSVEGEDRLAREEDDEEPIGRPSDSAERMARTEASVTSARGEVVKESMM